MRTSSSFENGMVTRLRIRMRQRGELLADPDGGGGHDVEVAGERRQVVAAPSTSRKTATRRMPPVTMLASSNCGSPRMR